MKLELIGICFGTEMNVKMNSKRSAISTDQVRILECRNAERRPDPPSRDVCLGFLFLFKPFSECRRTPQLILS
jgi:hypothetical protein